MITEKLKLICKKILDLSKNKISNLALQKLLYLIQAYSLIDSNEPVFEDKIEAWQYGPAVPEAYYYVRYKKKELDSLSTNNLKKNTEKYINEIFDTFGNIDPFVLVKLTQSYESWINSWRNSECIIKIESIKYCHQKLLKETNFIF